MNIKNAKKIGFFAALSISLGSVVGIGIFLKNISIIKAQMIDGSNQFSFISLIVSWVLGSVISLCAAYSFTEIATCKIGKSGLSGWVETLGGKKQGRFVKIAHSGIYFSILGSVIPMLAVEGMFSAINTAVNGKDAAPIHFGWVFFAGIIVFITLSCWNFFSIKSSSKFQTLGTFVKIIPLTLVIIIGFVGANNSHILNNNSAVVDGVNTETGLPVIGIPTTSTFNVSGMFLALPAILFSFDSFLAIGNLGNDVKNPQKTVPLVAVVTIIIAAIIYIFISIGAGLTGTGDAAGIIQTIVGKNNEAALNTINIIVNILITLSAIFVSNAISMASIRASESLVEDHNIMFYGFFEKLNNKKENLGGFVLYLMQCFFYMLIFGIPAVVMNSDAILDSATNAPVVLFFLVYAYTLFLGIKDRYTKKQCKPVKGTVITSSFAILFILIVFVYIFFYQNIYVVSITANNTSNSGLFFTHGVKWTVQNDAILFWTIFVWMIIWPLLNMYITNKQKGNEISKVKIELQDEKIQISE